jgi:hypothetical protein
MNTAQPEAGKKYFSLEEANKMLPLVRAIVQDITTLYEALTQRARKFEELGEEPVSLDRRDELDRLRDEFEKDEDRLREYLDELHKLGVEFKGFDLGLVDFPCWENGREICLCWKHGEPTIAFWHETWAGFAGRRPLGQRTEDRGQRTERR